MKLSPVVVLFAACAVVTSMSVFADTVYVQGGSRLDGTITRKSGDTLYLQTPYAGEVKVQWSKVVSIVTDKPVRLELGGESATALAGAGGEMSARIEESERGKVNIAPAGQRQEATVSTPVALSDILYINPLPEETAKGVAYRRRITLSAAQTRGNSTSERMNAEGEWDARARDYRYNVSGKINRAREGGALLTDNWLFAGNYDHFVAPKRFIYGRASLEEDAFKGIERRAIVGTGYGWQIIDSPATQLSLRSGPDYVMTRNADGTDDDYPSIGWGVKFQHKLGLGAVEIFHEQDGFWNIQETDDVTLRTRSGLRVPLIARMLASVQFNVDWEKNPAPGRKSTDSALMFGLGYEW